MSDRPACKCRINGIYPAHPSNCPDPIHSRNDDAYQTPQELARAEAEFLILRRLMSKRPGEGWE